MKRKKKTGLQLVETALRKHFGGYRLHNLVSASRMFPTSARVDLQTEMTTFVSRIALIVTSRGA
jgi:hypothetical protein